MGPFHYFLGMEVVRTPACLSLTQTKYILDLLRRTNIHESKPISTPAIGGHRLNLHEGEPLADYTEYCNIVGALQYLTFTHPDIAFVVNQVCSSCTSLLRFIG